VRSRPGTAPDDRKDTHPVTVEAAAPPSRAPRQRFTLDDVKKTYKRKDAWWTVLLVDPVASRLTVPVANHTNITPNQISFVSFLFGLGTAAAFAQGDHAMLALGALLFHVSFVLDCMDGKIARLKGTGSAFGMWLDFSFDQYKFWICAAGLAYGQYARTGDVLFIWLALFLAFFDMLRYLNAWQVAKVRREMDRRLKAAAREAQRRSRTLGSSYVVPGDLRARYVSHEDARDGGYHQVPGAMSAEATMYDRAPRGRSQLHSSFFARFGWWPRFRDAVMRYRVRPHLFSGIEYQMFVFVLGPLFDLVLPFALFSAAAMLLFELALVYKLWLSSKDFDRQMRLVTPSPAAARAEVTAAATAAGAPGAGQVPDAPTVPRDGVVQPVDAAAAR
jgi:phosphatidylglycerophosphate synthase